MNLQFSNILLHVLGTTEICITHAEQILYSGAASGFTEDVSQKYAIIMNTIAGLYENVSNRYVAEIYIQI